MTKHRFAAACLIATSLWALVGCQMLGIPSREEVQAAESAYEQAEQQIGELERIVEDMRLEREQAEAQRERTVAQKRTLSELQSRIALELAQAPEDARPFIEAQLDSVRRQMRAIDDQVRAFADVIAGWDSQLATAQARHRAATDQLAAKGEHLVEMQARAADAGNRVDQAIRQVGSLVGHYVPGAEAIAAQVGGGAAGLIGMGAATLFGGATIRARRRAQQAEKKADGAIQAMAITERFGIEEIVKSEDVRHAAREALRSNPEAEAAFRAAKAIA